MSFSTLQTGSRHLTDKLQLPFANTPSNAQSTLPMALSLGSTQDVLLETFLHQVGIRCRLGGSPSFSRAMKCNQLTM